MFRLRTLAIFREYHDTEDIQYKLTPLISTTAYRQTDRQTIVYEYMYDTPTY